MGFIEIIANTRQNYPHKGSYAFILLSSSHDFNSYYLIGLAVVLRSCLKTAFSIKFLSFFV